MKKITVVIVLTFFLPLMTWSQSTRERIKAWPEFKRTLQKKRSKQQMESFSYILSGSLAIASGVLGQGAATDPVEEGVYTLFQSIGVGAIGYGFAMRSLGDKNWEFYQILDSSKLSLKMKNRLLRSYYRIKRQRQKKLRLIKALTHVAIAGLNVYSASRQEKGSVQNGLYAIGGIHILLSLSYTF